MHLTSPLLAISVVTNTWNASLRFYTDGLGYQWLEDGTLSARQKRIFGSHLSGYALLGQPESEASPGSVIRLLETVDPDARPNRLGARPWDPGLAVFAVNTHDVDAAYWRVLRARFGAVAPPAGFDCVGPEPLGRIGMRSTAFIGSAGEQIFVTQPLRQQSRVSLWKESAVADIDPPANLVLSLQSREQQDWYRRTLGLVPVDDLLLAHPGAAGILGGPPDLGFARCLMGEGTERVGLEQHVYGERHPDYEYRMFPTDFAKTGLVSAAWRGQNLTELRQKLQAEGSEILGETGLPLRDNPEPKGLVFRGAVGEVLELVGE